MLNATREKKGLGTRRIRNPFNTPVYKLTFGLNDKGERIITDVKEVVLFKPKTGKQYPNKY